ncbi:hypothetical protein HK405_012052, partial [Cladochytrium tenue]
MDGSDDADAGSSVVRRRGVVVGRRPRAATLPQPGGDDAAASDAAAPSQAAAAPPLLPPRPPRGLSLPHPHSALMPQQPPPAPPGRPPPLPARSTVVPGPVINPSLLPMRTASMPKDSQPPPTPPPAHSRPQPPPLPSRSSTSSAAAAAAAEPGSTAPVHRALQSYSSVPALPRSAARRRTSDAEQPTASDVGSFPLLVGSGPNTMARITEEPASSAHAALPTTTMDSKLQALRTQRPQAPQRLGSGSSTVVEAAAAPAGQKAAYPSRGDSIGQNKYAFREVLASTASAESASSNPSLEATAVHSAPAPVSRRSTTLPRRVAT